MDYNISVAEDGKYILVKVNKPMTVELGRQCGDDSAKLGARLDVNTYLFDLRSAPNLERVTGNYNFAYEDMDNFGFKKGTRSALLVNKKDKSHDFIETAFRNAGFNVRLFCDEDSAVAWLGE